MTTLAEAFANYSKNRNVAAQVVEGTAASLTGPTNQAKVAALVGAGKLLSVTVTGTNANITAANMAKIVAMPKFALAAGATFEVADSAANILSNLPSLTKATKFTVSGANTVSIANAIILAGKVGFNLASGATLVVTGSATDILAATAATAKAKATAFTVSTATAAQAKTLAALTNFSTGSTITAVADTATAILALETAVLGKITSVTLTGANVLTVAQATSLGAKTINALASGATLVISGSASDLLGSSTALAKTMAKATGVTLTGANTDMTVTNANKLTAKTGFSMGSGASMELKGGAETLLTASEATRSKATTFQLTGANSIAVADAATLASAANFSLASTASLNVMGLVSDLTDAENSTALGFAHSITVTDDAITAAEAKTLVSIAGLKSDVTFLMTVEGEVDDFVGDNYAAVAKASSVHLSGNATGVSVADAIKLANIAGFDPENNDFEITGTVDALLAGNASKALALATGITASDTGTVEVSAAEASQLADLGDTLTISATLKVVDIYDNISNADLDLSLAGALLVTDAVDIADAVALIGDDSFDADATWSFSEVTGSATDLLDTDNEDVLDLGLKFTLSADAADVEIADATTLAALAGFNLGDHDFAITGVAADLTAADNAAAVALATSIEFSDDAVVLEDVATIVALNATATLTVTVADSAANILDSDYTSIVEALAEAGKLTFSGEEELTVAQAVALADLAALNDGDLSDFAGDNSVTITGTGTDLIDNEAALAGATAINVESATVEEAEAILGWADNYDVTIAKVADSAAALIAMTDLADADPAPEFYVSGNDNEVTIDQLTDLIAVFGGAAEDIALADGATLVVSDTWDNISDSITDLQDLAAAIDGLSIELGADESVELSITDYAASADALALLVGSPKVSLTVADSGEAGDLSDLTNAELINVSSISGADASDDLTIDLSEQTEGFTITGGVGADSIVGGAAANVIDAGDGDNDITGGAGADSITGGADDDVINGFAGADTVIGGEGDDELILSAGANADLANASDAALATVETITGASAATTINLTKQTEGFTITGGAGADVITGGAGADSITGAAGNDVITGGAGADTITGGDGNDSLTGGAGADAFVGFVGTDTIVGGDGADKLTLAAGANADLAAALDTAISGLETIEAAATATTINLSKQTEAFTITGGAEADVITGGAGADTINGGAEDDTITGGLGADSLTGGAGDDVFVGFAGADTIVGGDGDDKLTLAAGANTDVAAALDAAISGLDTVEGASTATAINLSKQTEAFTINGDAGNDTITGGAGADTIAGAAGNDVITGGASADVITAGAGADTIVGYVGADTVTGGDGVDTLVLTGSITTSDNGQLVSLEIISASTLTTATTINLTGQEDGFTINGGAGADSITGSSGADSISGGAGADVINGFAGADTILGGDGIDKLVLAAGANAALTSATDAVLAGVEIIEGAATATTINLSSQQEAFIINGGAEGDTITGTAKNDTVNGGAGGDSITGGQGADSISGGAGNDTFTNFSGADTLIGGEGSTDTLVLAAGANTDLANATDAALKEVEIITGAATASTINLSKQMEAFTITGGAEADTILGGAGADTIDGGAGADVITGGAGADSITGGAGNDTFNGFVGADTIVGGDGTTDTLVVTGSIASATDDQIAGVEVVTASLMTTAVTINLTSQGQSENYLVTGGSGNDTITGGAGADVITGGAGADSLTGGAGADTFTSFTGADTVVGGEGDDTLVLAVGANADLANASDAALKEVEFISLTTGATTASVINLSKQTEAFTVTGGGGNDTITGGAGNDNISGGAGNDTITGGLGNDTLTGGAGDDTFIGYVGTDIVTGGDGTDTLVLTGSITTSDNGQLVSLDVVSAATLTTATTINLTGQDDTLTIIGGSGNDTITSGTGVQTIKGGAGADTINGNATGVKTFDYRTLTDSLVASFDTIADYKATDQFKVGHTVSGSAFKQLTITTSSALATDLAATSRAASFVANGATLVTVSGGTAAGRYLVINDATAAFSATSDAVIKLSGTAAVANTNFVA